MYVQIKWALRRAKCDYCPEHVESGQAVLVVVIPKGQSLSNGHMMQITLKKYFHPQCWIAQSMQYLESHPPVRAPGSGRPKSIDDGKRQERKRIIARYHHLKNRLPKVDTDKQVSMLSEMGDLKERVQLTGAVPNWW